MALLTVYLLDIQMILITDYPFLTLFTQALSNQPISVVFPDILS